MMNKKPGFTLIEVLIASLLFTLIIGGIYLVFNISSQPFRYADFAATRVAHNILGGTKRLVPQEEGGIRGIERDYGILADIRNCSAIEDADMQLTIHPPANTITYTLGTNSIVLCMGVVDYDGVCETVAAPEDIQLVEPHEYTHYYYKGKKKPRYFWIISAGNDFELGGTTSVALNGTPTDSNNDDTIVWVRYWLENGNLYRREYHGSYTINAGEVIGYATQAYKPQLLNEYHGSCTVKFRLKYFEPYDSPGNNIDDDNDGKRDEGEEEIKSGEYLHERFRRIHKIEVELEVLIDNDRDGRYDEDPIDGKNNDNDKKIDEDPPEYVKMHSHVVPFLRRYVVEF